MGGTEALSVGLPLPVGVGEGVAVPVPVTVPVEVAETLPEAELVAGAEGVALGEAPRLSGGVDETEGVEVLV